MKELDHEVWVRPFVHDDVEAVVDLMRQLAVFEGYVEVAREKGVGERLFEAVIEEARGLGADRIDWTVLATNEPARRFYRGLGAGHDTSWENWGIRIRAPR